MINGDVTGRFSPTSFDATNVAKEINFETKIKF